MKNINYNEMHFAIFVVKLDYLIGYFIVDIRTGYLYSNGISLHKTYFNIWINVF